MSLPGTTIRTQFVMGLGLGALFLVGCSQGEKESGSIDSPPPAEAHAHNHPSEGPHGGGLIELGNEEYHAEFVHDDATGNVTIYLLDSTVKQSVSIPSDALLVNLSHDGQAEQFSLAANPESSDPSGSSSRFVSNSAELGEELDHEGVQPQLVVSINGKQYRGDIHHDHDHADHDNGSHEHESHEHDGHDH